MMKIKVGDEVLVIAGSSKGKNGRVIKTLRKENKVVIEGINMVKKHVKPRNQNDKGGIFDIESPIHVSNVKKINEIKEAKTSKTKKEVKKPKESKNK